LKIAIVVMQVGAPGTLATTAFIGALADGLRRIDTECRVFGLTDSAATWRPESLGSAEAVAPWLNPPEPTHRDRIEAAYRGVLGHRPPAQADLPPAWFKELRLQRELQKLAGGDDLMVLVHPRSYPILNMIARITARRGWRLVVLSNEALTDVQIDPKTRDDYVQLVTASCNGVWAVSKHLADYWTAHGLDESKVTISPGVVATSSFSESADIDEASAVYVGNLQHREIEYLLEISELVAAHLPRFRLHVYGDATPERRESLVTLLHDRGLLDVVTIHDAVAPADVKTVLARAGVLVLPRSRGEFSAAGFPQKLGEYLASGRPVVVTRVGDIPEYLSDMESAYLLAPDDCEAFAASMLEALRNQAAATRIGATGRNVARSLLWSEVVARRVVSFASSLESPSREWRLRDAVVPVAGGAAKAIQQTITYTRRGHTRVMALKICAVRVLRFLRLKPPAP